MGEIIVVPVKYPLPCWRISILCLDKAMEDSILLVNFKVLILS